MKPPEDIEARLDRLDELLFGEGAEPGRVFMHALTYADVRLWRGLKAEPPYERIDIESQAVFLKLGFVAVLVTHGPEAEPRQLWCSRLVPVGHIYIDSSGSFTPLEATPSEDQFVALDGV